MGGEKGPHVAAAAVAAPVATTGAAAAAAAVAIVVAVAAGISAAAAAVVTHVALVRVCPRLSLPPLFVYTHCYYNLYYL